MKKKILNFAFKAFFGKTMDEIEEDSRRRYARSRFQNAIELCILNGIDINSEPNILSPAIRDKPAVQNFLHQLGFCHAVFNFPPQTSEARYMLGYREGQR